MRSLAVRGRATHAHAVSGREHTHVRRACPTALFATAAEAVFCVLRNSLGTSNVPNLLCRAKTSWSCIEGDAGPVMLCLRWEEMH